MFIFKYLNFKHIHLYPMILSDNKITEIFYLVDEFYLSFEKTIQKHMSHLFPNTVSYNRFLELMQNATLPMSIFLKSCCMGEGTGISFIDSTPIRVGKKQADQAK